MNRKLFVIQSQPAADRGPSCTSRAYKLEAKEGSFPHPSDFLVTFAAMPLKRRCLSCFPRRFDLGQHSGNFLLIQTQGFANFPLGLAFVVSFDDFEMLRRDF